jgi:organic hydroperoxide reductase OsmC/OhrA
MTSHTYTSDLRWSGSTGDGYRAYDRTHTVAVGDASVLQLSADPTFRGDPNLPNPEQLLLAAASSCQLLSFLAVAALAHVDVVRYSDLAAAVMPGDSSPQRITEITLRPTIIVRGTDEETVRGLVEEAHKQCYIANSLTAVMHLAASVEVVS